VYHKTNNLKTFAPGKRVLSLCVGNKFLEICNEKEKEEEEMYWLT
jgi:hypothetical protein